MRKLILVAIFLVINIYCIEPGLKGAMTSALSKVDYPPYWSRHLRIDGVKGDVKQGVFPKANLSTFGATYGLPAQVHGKMQAMQWSKNLVLNSFSVYVVVNNANVQEYIGAAYANGENIHFAVIYIW